MICGLEAKALIETEALKKAEELRKRLEWEKEQAQKDAERRAKTLEHSIEETIPFCEKALSPFIIEEIKKGKSKITLAYTEHWDKELRKEKIVCVYYFEPCCYYDRTSAYDTLPHNTTCEVNLNILEAYLKDNCWSMEITRKIKGRIWGCGKNKTDNELIEFELTPSPSCI